MTANRHMKNREYQVIGNSDYISMMRHHGKVGKSRYDSVAESMKKSGFELVLVFGDGTSDGFFMNEVELDD